MVTGASTADLAVLLIDARKGILPQTRRHAAIASLLGIRQVVLAVNKMDLVGFEEAVFVSIRHDFRALLGKLAFDRITPIPICARDGDNVTTPSARMPWYTGVFAAGGAGSGRTRRPPRAGAFRMPVQYVTRPDHTFRGYAGTIATGTVRPGDRVVNAAAAPRPGSAHRHHGRRPGRSRRGPIRSPWCWTAKSTSPAATCSPPSRCPRSPTGRLPGSSGWTKPRCSAAAPTC